MCPAVSERYNKRCCREAFGGFGGPRAGRFRQFRGKPLEGSVGPARGVCAAVSERYNTWWLLFTYGTCKSLMELAGYIELTSWT